MNAAVVALETYYNLNEIVVKLEEKCDGYNGRVQRQIDAKNHSLVMELNREWNATIDLLKQARAARDNAKSAALSALEPLTETDVAEAKRIVRTSTNHAERNALHAQYHVSTYPH